MFIPKLSFNYSYHLTCILKLDMKSISIQIAKKFWKFPSQLTEYKLTTVTLIQIRV